MAYIFRLIIRRIVWILVGLATYALIGFFQKAYADYPSNKNYTYQLFSNQAQQSATSPQIACNAQIAFFKQLNSTNTGVQNSTATVFQFNLNEWRCYAGGFDAPNTNRFQIYVQHSCTPPSIYLNNGFCSGNITCTAPQVPNSDNTACVTPNPCEPKEGQTVSFFSNQAGGTGCVGSCLVLVDNGTCGFNATGQQGCFYDGTYDGSECTAIETPEPTNSPEYDCIKQGKSYGTVNGTVVCVPKNTAGASPVTTTDKSDKTVTNVNGTTSSTTTTTTNNNTVTTTTTTTAPDGTQSTETKEQDQQSFCEENPTSKLCKDDEKSTFAGSCSASFQCDGDAIQCAIAKEQHKRNCESDQDEQTLEATSAYETGTQLLNGQYDSDVQGFLDGTDESTRNVELTQLSESGAMNFTGEGLQNVTFTAMNQTVTLPLSNYNQYLEYMGFILLALSYMAAFKIVMGSV